MARATDQLDLSAGEHPPAASGWMWMTPWCAYGMPSLCDGVTCLCPCHREVNDDGQGDRPDQGSDRST